MFLKILSIYLFIYLFSERGWEGEREGEISRLVASCILPDQGRNRNLGTCPDWELNQQPFTLQNNVQSTEPHWSGLEVHFQLVE